LASDNNRFKTISITRGWYTFTVHNLSGYSYNHAAVRCLLEYEPPLVGIHFLNRQNTVTYNVIMPR